MSTFEFNKIFILESLTPNEPQTGTELEKRLNQWCSKQRINCQTVTFQIHSMLEWETVWNGIYTSIEKMGNVPIIHLEMHGNQSSVGIDRGAKGSIPLAEVFKKVQKANVLSHNNTFLSLAVCMGLNVIRGLNVYEPMPFCGILGSLETLKNEELLENYTVFYKAFLSTLNLDKAEQAMIDAGINAEKYNLFKPEQIFINAYLGYLETYKTDDQIEQKAKDAANSAGVVFKTEDDELKFLRDYRCTLLLYEDREYRRAVNSFFLFDKYPEIRNRFVVPQSIHNFKLLAGKNAPWLLDKRPLTFEDKKGLSIQILHEVDNFCTKNGIKYSLAYGTLIGAVRHKGFIPWDDDVDIMMLRPDYEKFIRSFNHDSTKLFSVASYATEKNFHYPMAKVSCNATVNEELGYDKLGYAIDVFAIDKFPTSDKEVQQVLKKKKQYWYLFAIKASRWNKKASVLKNLKWVFLKNTVGLIPYSTIHKNILNFIGQYDGLEGNYYLGCLATPYGSHDIFPKEFFSKYIKIPYENSQFSVLSEYDKCLISVYGDYMKLPPIEKRVTHHDFNAYWK